MLFSSIEFIFLFFPIFVIIYYIIPNKYRNHVLLMGSLVFYLIGVKNIPVYFILMIISTLINYLFGILIGNSRKKIYLILGIIYNFELLFIFKYFNFFSNMISSIGRFKPLLIELILPLGISFYTFQLVSYLVDVYKGKYKHETNLVKFSTYSLMFTKFISGPITKYDEVKKYLDRKEENNIYNIELGIKYFVIGLGFKVLLANRVGSVWSSANNLGFDSISSIFAILAIISYSLQLYFDFHGYTMMAIGIGKILGMELPSNFDHPYISRSMTEFWRKWHMTLGNWFKEYIYIPLGGNRKGIIRTIFNLLIVWLFTGLWHGADYNFIIWGLSLFVIIVIEKLFLKKFLDKHKILSHLYMIILIPLSWSIFAISDLSSLSILINKLTHFTSMGIDKYDYIKCLKDYGLFIVLGIIFSTKLPLIIYNKNKYKWIELVIILIIFWLSIYVLCIETNDPFMYFKF